jgi:hypothetical protein
MRSPGAQSKDLRLLLLNRENRCFSTGSKLEMEAKPIASSQMCQGAT